ncbi:MAG: pseudouridine synthase [Verrucomicrobia bacterium]|nr:pseudouridine synthase [Verrucomicrobiota bacterium]
MLLAFHKPYGVLSQFTPDGSPNRTLSAFGFPREVYPLGRLDADSEGLLLLSEEAGLNTRLLHPGQQHLRAYWVQVEGIPTESALAALRSGVEVQGRRTLPCSVRIIPPPRVADRHPPVRARKTVPDTWLELELSEGKNRQVRRMTAAVGHPTLRLLRFRIGRFELGELGPGQWVKLKESERRLVLAQPDRSSPDRISSPRGLH